MSEKISIVVAVRNGAKTLGQLLESLTVTEGKDLEIIVVDRDSTDRTTEIAKNYTDLVFNTGPERSAQRNFGGRRAKGEWLLFLDADMKASENLIDELRKLAQKDNIDAAIIPEVSFGEGFWSQVKAFERSFYIGDSSIEAPRFFRKSSFEKVGGYDEEMVAGEDWDLHTRFKEGSFVVGRTKAVLYHNEGRFNPLQSAKKKFFYGQKIAPYLKKGSYSTSQVTIFRSGFFKNPRALVTQPHLGLGLVVLKGLELSGAFLGLLSSFISRQNKGI